MPRNLKIADPKQSVQTERLWRWLVKNAAVADAADRWREAGRIISPMTSAPTRCVAVARAFLRLHFAGLERETLEYCHRFREETLADAKRASSLVSAMVGRLSQVAQRARADEDRSREVWHWPSAIADRLEARMAGIVGAQLVIEDVARAVDEIAVYSMDADTGRTVLDNLDNAALYLADGGMSWAEISDLRLKALVGLDGAAASSASVSVELTPTRPTTPFPRRSGRAPTERWCHGSP